MTPRPARAARHRLHSVAGRIWLTAALVAVVGACQSSIADSLTPTSALNMYVIVNNGYAKAASLMLNDTTRIVVQAVDIFKRPVGVRVGYISRNGLVASVSASGLIKGLANGSTWIVGSTLGASNSIILDSVQVQVTVVCTLEARPGIVVSILDSLSGSTGPFTSVAYVAREGAAYRDSTFIGNVPAASGAISFSAGLAYERTGTYDVSVKANGYKLWTKTGVVVTKDMCHVIAVPVTARLIAG